ncbi:MAG: DUF4157 domain-containing protein [Pyrinomonadaceae bacterium]|nr:DUF4157 domain-containing protein [Pyrinomonadaceae bacterium]
MREAVHAQPKAATPPSFTPVGGGVLQRKCACGDTAGIAGKCDGCDKKKLTLQRSTQNSETGNATSGSVPPIVQEALNSPGQPLDAETRAFMEPRFGHDFSRVRVHTDARAAESARQVNALAYTLGNNIALAGGQYSPATLAGKRLLAHELTHVVQQSAATPLGVHQHPIETNTNRSKVSEVALAVGSPVRSDAQPKQAISVGPADDPLEQQADLVAEQVCSDDSFLRPSSVGVDIGKNSPTQASPAAQTAHRIGAVNAAVIQRQEAEPAPAEDAGWDLGGLVRWFNCLPGTSGDPMADPMADISVFQSPGASGWWGARFGCYRNNCNRNHQGWDLHAATGTEVRAVSTGNITHHNNPGGYGNYILLHTRANADRTYMYAHLSQREPVGDYCPGDKIGETGITGNASATRPHLHFEVRNTGAPTDPSAFLTEPGSVVEATGSATAAIDKSLPAPCAPC